MSDDHNTMNQESRERLAKFLESLTIILRDPQKNIDLLTGETDIGLLEIDRVSTTKVERVPGASIYVHLDLQVRDA